MKIAEVCPRYYPYIGGVEKHVEEISKNLVNQGLDVEVLTTDPSGKLPDEELRNGVKIKRFKCFSPLKAYYSSPSLKHYLKERSKNYEIIHAHHYQSLPALYAVQSKNDYKLVFTPHYHRFSVSWLSKFLRVPYHYLWLNILKNVDKFIFVSNSEKLSFFDEFKIPFNKTVVIPNGINTKMIQRTQPFDIDKSVILYVGRLEKYKNIHNIIQAIKYVDQQYILVIVGDGPYKKSLLKLSEKLNLQERIKIVTGLEDNEVYKWYRSCKVCLNLSNIEAFGITVIEAIAAGKPVILSDIPEFCEHANTLNGIQLVNVQSTAPQELANTIMRTAQKSPSSNDLSQYSWDNITNRVRQVYIDVLNEETPNHQRNIPHI